MKLKLFSQRQYARHRIVAIVRQSLGYPGQNPGLDGGIEIQCSRCGAFGG
jgi:hypothetical protein